MCTISLVPQKSGVNEQELTDLRSENRGSKIEVFGVVDLDSQYTFALKVQYISGWLFERNRAIGRYFEITLTIILLSWS